MRRESNNMADGNDLSWGKENPSISNSESLAFLEIRLHTLAKTIDEIKIRRLRLENDLRRGYVPESEYASSLLKLIVESNTLSRQRDEVAERVRLLKTKGFVQR